MLQLAAILVAASVFDLDLPYAFLLALIGISALSNAALFFWARAREATVSGWVLVFDTVVLTGLLGFSGGAANPLSILYLLQVTLAALMLGARWTWSITALSGAAYGLLFVAAQPAEGHHGGMFAAHLQGMWLAFMAASCLLAYFVGGLSRAVRAQDAELERLRDEAEKNARLAALTTLAAGAAHELNTPLSTVAVVAKEIERQASQLPEVAGGRLAGDARLIRAELERCRHILEQMGAHAAEQAREASELTRVDAFIEEVRGALDAGRARRLRVVREGVPDAVLAPPKALHQIVLSLVDNAFDASPPDAEVVLSLTAAGREVHFSVSDRGTGMTAEVLARAVEPFFTTKSPGDGLGLGLFLVQSFADRLGGRLELDSAPGRGTSATLILPAGST